MMFLFVLMLMTAGSFSMYLYLHEIVNNPLIYVFLGWSTTVVAYYLSWFLDLTKINILNRNFQAFVINGEGEYWDGIKFNIDNETEPLLVYNDLQIDTLIKRVIRLTGQNDLYIRIMPPEPLEEGE